MLRSFALEKYGKKLARRKVKHTSMRRVSITGKPAPSWIPAVDLTEWANECFRACLSPHAKPDLVRVFWNSKSSDYGGRCYIEQRIITIANRNDYTRTLAHEIAHLRFRKHGKRHAELTTELHGWLLSHPRIVTLPEDMPKEPKIPKPRPAKGELQTKRYTNLMVRIKDWETKEKRAQTALKKLRKQQRYYERALAQI